MIYTLYNLFEYFDCVVKVVDCRSNNYLPVYRFAGDHGLLEHRTTVPLSDIHLRSHSLSKSTIEYLPHYRESSRKQYVTEGLPAPLDKSALHFRKGGFWRLNERIAQPMAKWWPLKSKFTSYSISIDEWGTICAEKLLVQLFLLHSNFLIFKQR